MSSTSKKGKVKAKVEGDAKKLGHDAKAAGKDVEKAAQKGARDIKSAGQKLKKKL